MFLCFAQLCYILQGLANFKEKYKEFLDKLIAVKPELAVILAAKNLSQNVVQSEPTQKERNNLCFNH